MNIYTLCIDFISEMCKMYDNNGERKYVNFRERNLIYIRSGEIGRDEGAFLHILLETGCRISEALNLKTGQIDIDSQSIRIESLKKRRRGVFRSVPISDRLLRRLERVCRLNRRTTGGNEPIWTWSRATAYRMVKRNMTAVGIAGPWANPRGLRHGFAVAALESGVPITLVQRWLGHSSLRTTAIYTEVVGQEERRLAARMWRRNRQGNALYK